MQSAAFSAFYRGANGIFFENSVMAFFPSPEPHRGHPLSKSGDNIKNKYGTPFPLKPVR